MQGLGGQGKPKTQNNLRFFVTNVALIEHSPVKVFIVSAKSLVHEKPVSLDTKFHGEYRSKAVKK